jgi:hypothetical protein
MTAAKCFACDRPLGKDTRRATTRDGQRVYVGADCHRKIRAAGDDGYQPPGGGPRLYPLSPEDTRAEQVERMARTRAARFGKAGVVGMSPEELAMRATLATTLAAKARWLRKISARGLTLTPKQREIVAREHARKLAKDSPE